MTDDKTVTCTMTVALRNRIAQSLLAELHTWRDVPSEPLRVDDVSIILSGMARETRKEINEALSAIRYPGYGSFESDDPLRLPFGM